MIKREDISKLTPEQAADELVFMEFEKALKSAKRKAVAAHNAQNHIFELLEDMCIDAEGIPTKAENASNLYEAITCYLDFGEYTLTGIMREVRAAYGQGELE